MDSLIDWSPWKSDVLSRRTGRRDCSGSSDKAVLARKEILLGRWRSESPSLAEEEEEEEEMDPSTILKLLRSSVS